MSTFRTDTPFLKNVLKDMELGKIQLPDFQRDWRWDDYRTRSIIASVSQAFPIGMIMELEMGGRDTQFGSRYFDGVNPETDLADPEFLVLDGQQRLTALYQSLMVGTAVFKRNAKGTEDRRLCYYLDMQKCLKPEIEREEAVRSYEENREKILQLEMFPGENVDFSLVDNQYAHAMFPVHRIFDSDDWGDAYKAYWRDREDPCSMGQLFNKFNSQVIKHFEQYTVPILILEKETSREEVCRVFERVNNRGLTLTVFELLTAIFAVSGFQLREDWNRRKECLAKWSVLQKFDGPSFLQTLTLLATNANPKTSTSCTRKSILRLSVEDYDRWADEVEEGLKRAARFLHSQQIFDDNSLAYPAQLVPLAAIWANLGKEANIGEQKKLARWYWCGVLGELYGTSADFRFANDLAEVPAWIKGGAAEEPATVREAIFLEDRLEELRNKNSAAYKGVHALLMNNGCLHFKTGETIGLQTASNESIDIHHVFPIAWCNTNEIDKDVYNSIINKTPLARETNNSIGAKAPSEYLSKFWTDDKTDQDIMDKILASHLICADALRKNDFWRFFNARKEALLKVIAEAMGKPVVRDEDDDSDASA